MTFAAITFLAAAAARVLMSRRMRKPTRESPEERIRNDFDFAETDPKITKLDRRLIEKKTACKPNRPRPVSLVAVNFSQGSAFSLTTASHIWPRALQPLVGSLSAIVAVILLYASDHAERAGAPGASGLCI